MDMNFRWNRTPELGQAAAALAGATPAAGAANAPRGDFNYMLGQARDAQNAAMAAQAQLASDPGYQRFKELEAERNAYLAKQKAFIENPNTQMAIGMALGGQPGALMSLIMENGKGDAGKVSQYQEKMDNLEKDMMIDIAALGGYNQAERSKLQKMLQTVYASKFQELLDNGATSRMGGWPAWLEYLGATQADVDAAKAEAKRKANIISKVRGHKK
jgi:hypothetical protein